jgi:hypothetical protein
MFAPATQPANTPVAEQRSQFDWGAKPKEFRFHLHAVSGDYFTIPIGAFLALRFDITNGGDAACRSSICIWIAKRSLPIRATMVEVPGSSGGLGKGNMLFLRFFTGPVMPRVPDQKQVSAPD